MVAGLLLLYACYLAHKIILAWRNDQDIDKSKIEIAALVLSLALAFFSIYSSNKTLEDSRKFFMIQTRPYVGILGAAINVQDGGQLRNGVEKLCEYTIALKNYGNIPATDVASEINISFKNKQGDLVVLSTHPRKDEILITPSTGPFFIGPGDTTRFITGTLYINQDDADPIKAGAKTVILDVKISYSASEYDTKWKYEISAVSTGKNFAINKESESVVKK